ncbi:hypothetical protein GKZ90_0019400 [Flavobacterium sp. MC2016-06]|jgi:hypothetical protein|uniref:hypothetical protein n=1 Tax=Flavobacterium sp. MC2016-06 TaxID=2676308 RepID=UPI0012BB027D|nr:hypothetical protein [Flavobacterium sp. MC2016-06]MBU3861965.1 hypothetical protein [Flavobacterium sp. MC2016-06]
MQTSEIKTIEYLRKLSTIYFTTLKPDNDKTKVNTAQIKFTNYYELGCTITEMLKLCILAQDYNSNKISETNKNKPIDVSAILEMVLEIFPLNEFEFLSDLSEMLAEDSNNVCE